MSLINDALKRAKEQQDVAPPPLPPMHAPPAIKQAEPSRNAFWLIPAGLGAVALIACGVAWHLTFGKSQSASLFGKTEARARASQQPPTPEPSPGKPAAESTVPMVAAAQQAAATLEKVNQVAVENARQIAAVTSNTATQATPAALSPLPSFKLQSIVYNPKRPSAMINGKTLFKGEYLENFVLVQVGPNFALLTNGAQEVRLVLE